MSKFLLTLMLLLPTLSTPASNASMETQNLNTLAKETPTSDSNKDHYVFYHNPMLPVQQSPEAKEEQEERADAFKTAIKNRALKKIQPVTRGYQERKKLHLEQEQALIVKESLKLTEEERRKKAFYIYKALQKYQDKKIKAFLDFLRTIPFDQFRDLICTNDYIDETDWFYRFLEIKFAQEIFARDTDGSLNPNSFTASFLQKQSKITDPHAWLDQQIINYLTSFHATCYQEFEKRAMQQILQANLSWTDAVSIRNPVTTSPYKFLYPINYSGNPYLAVENYPPIDSVNIVLAEIFLKVLMEKNYQQLKNLNPQYSVNLDTLPTTSSTDVNFLTSTKLFDQNVTQNISTTYSQLQGYAPKCRFLDGSLITRDNQSFYYYRFNAGANRLELHNTCQCNFNTRNLQAFHVSTDKKTIYGIHHDTQDRLFAWNFTVKDSRPENKPITIINLQDAKKIDAKLFNILKTKTILQLSDIQASDQFIVGIFENDRSTKDTLIILQKSDTKPEEFSLVEIAAPIEFDSSVKLHLHNRTNRLAIVDSYHDKIIIYQLNNNQPPSLLKILQDSSSAQGSDRSPHDPSIKTMHWSPDGSLFAIINQNQFPETKAAIRILDSSTYKEIDRFYSDEDNPKVEISPNNQYCLYIQNTDPYSQNVTYTIRDLRKKKKFLSLTNDFKIIPWRLHWNSNPEKNQLFCFINSNINQQLSLNTTALDLNTFTNKTIPSLIEYALWQYLFNLGKPRLAKAPRPIRTLAKTNTTTQADIDLHYATEHARYEQEHYEYENARSYHNDYAYTAKQCFLLGQLFFENRTQAFDELGGTAWLRKQPKDFQKLVQSNVNLRK